MPKAKTNANSNQKHDNKSCSKSALQAVDKEREKAIEAGKDPDDDVLNIGEIE